MNAKTTFVRFFTKSTSLNLTATTWIICRVSANSGKGIFCWQAISFLLLLKIILCHFCHLLWCVLFWCIFNAMKFDPWVQGRKVSIQAGPISKKLGTQNCHLFSHIAKNATCFTHSYVPKWPYWCKMLYWTAFVHLEMLHNVTDYWSVTKRNMLLLPATVLIHNNLQSGGEVLFSERSAFYFKVNCGLAES